MIAAGSVLLLAGALVWQFREAWDIAGYWRLHAPTSGPPAVSLVRLTDLGGAAVMVPVALAAAAWLAWRTRRAEAIWLIATVASGRLVIEGAKAAAGRPRPPLAYRLATVDTASFPSSHSAGTMLTVLAVAIALRSGKAGALGAVAPAVAVGQRGSRSASIGRATSSGGGGWACSGPG